VSEPVENPYAAPLSALPPLSAAEEKQWALLTHVLSIFLGPLSAVVLWVLFKERGPFVRAHVTTEWNWQLTILAGSVACIGVSIFSTFFSYTDSSRGQSSLGLGLFLVGYLGVIVLHLVGAAFSIAAAIAANKGDMYRHPLAYSFVG